MTMHFDERRASIKFTERLRPDQIKFVKHFLEVVAVDEYQALTDIQKMEREDLSQLSRNLMQVVNIELHDEGDIKTMSDGTCYLLEKDGWKELSASSKGNEWVIKMGKLIEVEILKEFGEMKPFFLNVLDVITTGEEQEAASYVSNIEADCLKEVLIVLLASILKEHNDG